MPSKRVITASVLQLLNDEKRRAELVQSTFEATFELYGDDIKLRVVALSVFRGSFGTCYNGLPLGCSLFG